MNKKVENYLQYGVQPVTGKEVFENAVHMGVLAVLWTFFRYSAVAIHPALLLFLLVDVVLGICSIIRKRKITLHLYKGITSSGLAAIYDMLSCRFAIAAGADNRIRWVFIAGYVLVVISVGLLVWRKIRKDAYSGEYRAASPVGAYGGAALAMILGPLLFSCIHGKIVPAILSGSALFIGSCFLFGVNDLIKVVLLWRAGSIQAIDGSP